MKSLSVIMNRYPCQRNCWYCIWKEHPLRHERGPKNLSKLKNSILQVKEADGRVSVSGGGDPTDDLGLLDSIVGLCKQAEVPLHLHTSNKSMPKPSYQIFSKVVFHVGPNELFDLDMFRFLSGLYTKVRFNFVVTSDFDLVNLSSYFDFLESLDCEVGMRELVSDDNDRHCSSLTLEKIWLRQTEKIRFIPHDDYNFYYMPDDRIYSNYFLKGGPYDEV